MERYGGKGRKEGVETNIVHSGLFDTKEINNNNNNNTVVMMGTVILCSQPHN